MAEDGNGFNCENQQMCQSRGTSLFPVLVYKCLVNNTVLSDFQYCILLMFKNQVNIKTHPKKFKNRIRN